MKRPSPHFTRRQRAIRRGLGAVVLLLVTLAISLAFPLHPFTPAQAMDTAARRHGALETQPVAQRTFQGVTFTLSANDQLLLLSAYAPDQQGGWENSGQGTPAAQRTREDGPLWAVTWSLADPEGDYLQLAGLTELDEAVTARAKLPCNDPAQPPLRLETEVLTGEGGQRYFWFCQDRPENGFALEQISVTLLDGDGNPLATWQNIP